MTIDEFIFIEYFWLVSKKINAGLSQKITVFFGHEFACKQNRPPLQLLPLPGARASWLGYPPG